MMVGTNSRLDELQAGLLRVKLEHLDELNKDREIIAYRYLNEIKSDNIILPKIKQNVGHVWHLFVITTDFREQLISHLERSGINTMIHYPIPPHLSDAYEYLGYKIGDFPITERLSQQVLTLPLYNGMTVEETSFVINAINNFNII